MSMRKVTVFLLCSGLGHISRGFESFTQECFDALSGEPELNLTLFQGGGRSEGKQITLWNLPRSAPLTEWLGKKTRKGGYWLEQITFTLSLLPHVIRQKPDVIYFSDCNIGNLLWHWRRLTKQDFKLLLSNGGPLKPPFPRWDFVQQISQPIADAALAAGQPAEKQSLVPYGFQMSPLSNLPPETVAAKRTDLGLPLNRTIVLSVGAINSVQKRMDYVIREMANLPQPRPFLLLIGQQDEGTPQITELADELLGADGFAIKTVTHEKISDYYQVADAFVLASLHEGFGRVFVEAMSHGLPCMANDYAQVRSLLGDSGYYADFSQPSQLTQLLCGLLLALPKNGPEMKLRRHQSVYQRFSWAELKPKYIAMIQRCAASA